MEKKKKDEIKEEVAETTEEEIKKEETVVLTKAQAEEITTKLKDAEDKAMRAVADLVNYRKRKDEETARMLNFCNEGLITDLLPSIDNLERALMQEDDSKLKEGVTMIYTMIKNTLESYGLKEIEALGLKFDPNYHQAVTTDSVKDKEEDVVLDVLQKGYTLKGKVIRPAMVKVNK